MIGVQCSNTRICTVLSSVITKQLFHPTETACDPTKHADLAAVVMQEGLAHLCLITSNMTLVRAKIETNIPRKRKGMCQQHDKVSQTSEGERDGS